MYFCLECKEPCLEFVPFGEGEYFVVVWSEHECVDYKKYEQEQFIIDLIVGEKFKKRFDKAHKDKYEEDTRWMDGE